MSLSTRTPVSSQQSNRAREVDCGDNHLATLEPHVCRACFSRIASYPAAGGGRLYQCTNCEVEAVGASAAVVCACGIKLRKRKTSGASSLVLADAGIRCHLNEAPTPEFPARYVASYRGNSD